MWLLHNALTSLAIEQNHYQICACMCNYAPSVTYGYMCTGMPLMPLLNDKGPWRSWHNAPVWLSVDRKYVVQPSECIYQQPSLYLKTCSTNSRKKFWGRLGAIEIQPMNSPFPVIWPPDDKKLRNQDDNKYGSKEKGVYQLRRIYKRECISFEGFIKGSVSASKDLS